MSNSPKVLIKNNTVYDVLKYVALIVLPALATLYFALSQIWGLPYGSEIVGTITAFDTFLGFVLKISTTAYDKSDSKFDGTIDVIEDDDKKLFSLNVDGDPYKLEDRSELRFKVNTVKNNY